MEGETPGNGWTKYQLMVLTELKRLDQNQAALSHEITQLKILVNQLQYELRAQSSQMQQLIEQLKKSEDILQTKVTEIDNVTSDLLYDSKLLKWKIGAFGSAVSVVFGVAVQLAIKFFLH